MRPQSPPGPYLSISGFSTLLKSTSAVLEKKITVYLFICRDLLLPSTLQRQKQLFWSVFHSPKVVRMLLTIPHWLQETTIGVCAPVWNGPGCVTAHDLHIPVIAAQTWTLILRVCQSSRCAVKASLTGLHLSVSWTDTRHGAWKTIYPRRSVKNIKSSPAKKNLKAALYPPGSTQIRGVVTVKNHQTLTSTACGNSRQCCGKCGSLFKQLPPREAPTSTQPPGNGQTIKGVLSVL